MLFRIREVYKMGEFLLEGKGKFFRYWNEELRNDRGILYFEKDFFFVLNFLKIVRLGVVNGLKGKEKGKGILCFGLIK